MLGCWGCHAAQLRGEGAPGQAESERDCHVETWLEEDGTLARVRRLIPLPCTVGALATSFLLRSRASLRLSGLLSARACASTVATPPRLRCGAGGGPPVQLLWEASEHSVPDLVLLHGDEGTWEWLHMCTMREGRLTFFLEPEDSRFEAILHRVLNHCERCMRPAKVSRLGFL